MNCVSCDICVYHLGLCVCVFFPGVFLSSRVTGACPVTTDLIMRGNVRTTTTAREVLQRHTQTRKEGDLLAPPLTASLRFFWRSAVVRGYPGCILRAS